MYISTISRKDQARQQNVANGLKLTKEEVYKMNTNKHVAGNSAMADALAVAFNGDKEVEAEAPSAVNRDSVPTSNNEEVLITGEVSDGETSLDEELVENDNIDDEGEEDLEDYSDDEDDEDDDDSDDDSDDEDNVDIESLIENPSLMGIVPEMVMHSSKPVLVLNINLSGGNRALFEEYKDELSDIELDEGISRNFMFPIQSANEAKGRLEGNLSKPIKKIMTYLDKLNANSFAVYGEDSVIENVSTSLAETTEDVAMHLVATASFNLNELAPNGVELPGDEDQEGVIIPWEDLVAVSTYTTEATESEFDSSSSSNFVTLLSFEFPAFYTTSRPDKLTGRVTSFLSKWAERVSIPVYLSFTFDTKESVLNPEVASTVQALLENEYEVHTSNSLLREVYQDDEIEEFETSIPVNLTPQTEDDLSTLFQLGGELLLIRCLNNVAGEDLADEDVEIY